MDRRAFLFALGCISVFAELFRGRRSKAAAWPAQDPDELVLVDGWIVKRSQAPEGDWEPAP